MTEPAPDDRLMARAVELAARGLGRTRPNPAVGAVVARGGRIFGEGWHRRAGCDHAEVAAIKNALAKAGAGRAADAAENGFFKDATLYVTLEPCSSPGRVGACTDAIIAAGIPKVVYAVPDPNPKNRGKAKRALAKAGIACERFKGDRGVLKSAESLVRGFRKHILTGLPFVTVKIAMSLDGRICDCAGNAKWISSEGSRRITGCGLRDAADAIMVGAETVRRDNPSLLCHGRRHDGLIRVVVSKSGNLPADARLFTDGAPNATLVFDDAKKALAELGRMGVTSVLCEGGLNLARSLADQGLVDSWITVMAPKVIGSRTVEKALCGKIDTDGSRVRCGDSFLSVDFGG